MAKAKSNPILYNGLKRINITTLKAMGSLSIYFSDKRNINWVDGSSVCIESYSNESNPFINLTYNWRGTEISYSIELVKKQTNLNKGFMWLFICPISRKLCRNLYFINGKFAHRETAKNAMYESQVKSKYDRSIGNIYEYGINISKLNDDLKKPYFKNFYNGKPTKAFIRLHKRMKQLGVL